MTVSPFHEKKMVRSWDKSFQLLTGQKNGAVAIRAI